jgi:hypothetical protein
MYVIRSPAVVADLFRSRFHGAPIVRANKRLVSDQEILERYPNPIRISRLRY